MKLMMRFLVRSLKSQIDKRGSVIYELDDMNNLIFRLSFYGVSDVMLRACKESREEKMERF